MTNKPNNVPSSSSNPTSYYQQSSNHDGIIEPLKSKSAVICKEKFSTINLDKMKQMNYHNNAELIGMLIVEIIQFRRVINYSF